MDNAWKFKIILNGIVAAAALVLFYFAVVSAISGFSFALSQFSNYWYFLASLAVGFGVQISLYSYLRQLVKRVNTTADGKTVAVTGTTSGLAMVSCCAHYLANIAPILGVAGALSIVAEYQIEIFWIGLAFNIFGIIFIARRIAGFKAHI